MAIDPKVMPKVMQAVEALGYRATVGDVAAQAGLQIPVAEQGLLALASEVGGQLQVAESGDIAYSFPKGFRSILWGKSWKLRFKAALGQVWKVIFYGIRISFGLALLASIGILAIALILLAIAAVTAASSRDDNDNGAFDLSGLFVVVGDILGSALRLFFYANWYGWGPSYGLGYGSPRRSSSKGRSNGGFRRALGRGATAQGGSELNFLEAVFSFLFGDGDPNADLDDRRWREIGQVIRDNQGAIVAEQALPYLDAEPQVDPDDAILPVLVRFQGQPQVSPEGELVYQFPELQVTAAEQSRTPTPGAAPAFLQEQPWRFSRATPTQLWSAGLLGAINLGLAIVVGLQLPALDALGGSFLAVVAQLYPLLLLYGLGFLLVPLLRWQVVRWRDRGVQARNQQRRSLAQQLQVPTAALRAKLHYARQFAQQQQLRPEDAAYTTEQDLIEQDIAQQAQQDAAWQRRLEEGQQG